MSPDDFDHITAPMLSAAILELCLSPGFIADIPHGMEFLPPLGPDGKPLLPDLPTAAGAAFLRNVMRLYEPPEILP